MTCDHAIELLPWLLNGSLAEGERDEMWHHLEMCERCRQSLAETREAWSVFAQHLPSQDLVALAWGETPTAAVEEHLVSCPSCAAELELARMSRRLEEEDNVALFPAAAKPRTETGRAYRGWRAAAIAASLAGLIAAGGWFQSLRAPVQAVVASGGRRPAVTQPQARPAHGAAESEIAALRQKVKELSDYADGLKGQVEKAQDQVAQRTEQPDLTAAPWLSGFVSSTDVVRGEGDEEIATVPAKASLAVLPLRATRPETGTHENHEVVILAENGKLVTTKQAQWDRNGWYLLALARGELKPGTYTLQAYGRTGGKREPEPDGTYKIRVQ